MAQGLPNYDELFGPGFEPEIDDHLDDALPLYGNVIECTHIDEEPDDFDEIPVLKPIEVAPLPPDFAQRGKLLQRMVSHSLMWRKELQLEELRHIVLLRSDEERACLAASLGCYDLNPDDTFELWGAEVQVRGKPTKA